MKTTQFSTPIVVVVSALLIFNAYQAKMNYANMSIVIIVTSVFLTIVGLLFYKLDIVINPQEIFMSFGIGLITKRIPLDSISRIKQVKNSVFAGWGLRFHPKYTLYSASSLKAVEISFKDSSMKIRIGTSEPQEIESYLSTYISQH